MGQTIQAQCMGCDFHAELHTGNSFLDCDGQKVAQRLPAKERTRFCAALAAGAVFISVQRDMAACQNCGFLFVRQAAAWDLQGTIDEVSTKCPVCQGAQATVLRKGEAVQCPECGSEVLLFEVGHWN